MPVSGYTSGRKEIIEYLRQRSRPYLFSNTLAPSIAGASLQVLELLSASTELRDKLEANTRFFREGMGQLGFNLLPGTHAIYPQRCLAMRHSHRNLPTRC